LASLSDEEFAQKLTDFSRQMHQKDYGMYDLYDEVTRLERAELDAANMNKPVSPEVVIGVISKRRTFQDFMNAIVQNDVPKAMEFREELVKRVPEAEKLKLQLPVAAVVSLNAFLTQCSALDGWASQLSAKKTHP
jgi:hypothetical protein